MGHWGTCPSTSNNNFVQLAKSVTADFGSLMPIQVYRGKAINPTSFCFKSDFIHVTGAKTVIGMAAMNTF